MKLKRLSIYDIKDYLKKYSPIYISYLVLFLVGILLAVIIAMSGDSYLKLLTKENKILYTIINGSLGVGKIFWKQLGLMIFPIILTLLIGLNFYSCLITYVMVAYQSALLTLSIFAIVSTYGVSGVLNSLFIILPINLLYIMVLIFFASVCVRRSYIAMKTKCFAYGYKENEFIFGLIISFVAILTVCVIGSIIVPMFLKNAIFIIF